MSSMERIKAVCKADKIWYNIHMNKLEESQEEGKLEC